MKYGTKYYVNKDKRTVVCTIECNEFDAIDYVENSQVLALYYGGADPKHTYSHALMPTKFVGIAKCSTEDVFDEHIGRLLAFNRAKSKYDKALNVRVLYLLRKQDEARTYTLRRLTSYNDKAHYHQNRRRNEINEYLNK